MEWINEISGRVYQHARGKPPVEQGESELRVRFAQDVAPSQWSNWATCSEGCCLSYDGGDKANHMVPWIKHLLEVYLKPGATAEGWPGFEAFTFDHMVDGIVVGSRRDTGELFSIAVQDNEVEIEMLWPGVPEWSSYPPLRYQVEIDKRREWRASHRQELARQAARARAGDYGDYW